jgi:hypothetical protein
MQNISKISPVLQFSLLLIPTVFTSFFFVFAVVGTQLDGRDKTQWVVEALDVSLMTGALIIGYSALVLLLVKYRQLGSKHLLALSSYAHIVISLGLVVLTLSIVK